MLFCPSFTQSARFLHTDQLSSPAFDVLNQQRVVVMTNFIRMLSGNVIVNVFKSDSSDLVGSDLPHLLIDVRQNAASVKVPELYDEPLEAS